jgi:outer membrane immunogenic protein
MRRWKFLFAGAKYLLAGTFVAGAFVAMSGGVNADGTARKAPAPQLVQQAPATWSGVYFGVHSGWAWSDFDATYPAFGTAFGVSHDAPVVGGQIGIQHQFGNFVLGVEGTLTTAYRDDYASTDCPNPTFTCAARFDDVLTIGPRLGWAMGKWMPYITGGYANAAFSEKEVVKANNLSVHSDRQRHSGWYIGGGVEMALAAGWTVGLEYRHYEFDDAAYQPHLPSGVVQFPTDLNIADVSLDIVTLRVSWKFDRPSRVEAKPLK